MFDDDDAYAQTGFCNGLVDVDGYISTGAFLPEGENPIWIDRGEDGSDFIGVEPRLDV